MKAIRQSAALALIALTIFPLNAEAFSRRPDRSEIGPTPVKAGPLRDNAQTQQDVANGGPVQSVPEPSSALLLAAGAVLMVAISRQKRLSGRRSDSTR